MIGVIGLAILSGATLGHLGMPALIQPTHLLAASLLFGLQFLIWMSYRHARSGVDPEYPNMSGGQAAIDHSRQAT